MEENELIKTIEENLILQKKSGIKFNPGNLGKKWNMVVANEPKRFINSDFTLCKEALKNFRGLSVFIPDWPDSKPTFLNIRDVLDGGRRGLREFLKSRLKILKDYNFTGLLKKYPCSLTGNPNIYCHEGYRYTYRWSRHIYLLGLFKKIFEKRINSRFICMDIGSSYGIFSSLLKREFPESHHILLDFPEQLVLAHYFLGKEFPEAKIASFKEIHDVEKIDKDFILKYDFILLPCMYYERLAENSLDLLTNFLSFGEMSRKYFDYYLKNEPFLSTKYFFTVNRFHSDSTYENDISVLDYPFNDFAKLHFEIFPLVSKRYKRHHLFFYEPFPYPSQCFEFLGERKP
ncbi:MAG: putative sugar O-methyltransferase [Candidatus Omnitrophica bacterium]|nr:putative sugar O-methyltransferase [Candidatus Omnitrophota bacterium]